MTTLLILIFVAAGGACVLALATILVHRGTARAISAKLVGLEQELKSLAPAIREESKTARTELREILAANQLALEARFTTFNQVQADLHRVVEERLAAFETAQAAQLAAMRKEAVDGRTAQEHALNERTKAFADTQTIRLGETNQAMAALAERLEKAQTEARSAQKEALEAVTTQIRTMTESNERKQDSIRETLTQNLEAVRKDNETKLEAMRATVEDKLQGTLEKRLGESFKLVTDQLDRVHQGLGEMQSLATGVGDLKRVLTNVKSRGGWGEVQLGILLEDMLAPDQYTRNVRIRPDSNEVVEFAVKLPGKGEGFLSSCRSTPNSLTKTMIGSLLPRMAAQRRILIGLEPPLSAPYGRRRKPFAKSTSIRRGPPTSQSCTCRRKGCLPKQSGDRVYAPTFRTSIG